MSKVKHTKGDWQAQKVRLSVPVEGIFRQVAADILIMWLQATGANVCGFLRPVVDENHMIPYCTLLPRKLVRLDLGALLSYAFTGLRQNCQLISKKM